LLRDLFNVDCTIEAADAPARCNCWAPGDFATFEVDEADPWTLCEIAVERCPELVEVEMAGLVSL
jgi:hypothetical protein